MSHEEQHEVGTLGARSNRGLGERNNHNAHRAARASASASVTGCRAPREAEVLIGARFTGLQRLFLVGDEQQQAGNLRATSCLGRRRKLLFAISCPESSHAQTPSPRGALLGGNCNLRTSITTPVRSTAEVSALLPSPLQRFQEKGQPLGVPIVLAQALCNPTCAYETLDSPSLP